MKTVMIKIEGKEVEAEILKTYLRGADNYTIDLEGVKYRFQYDQNPYYANEFYKYQAGYLIIRGKGKNKNVICDVWLKHLQ